jgi:YfiH family protein
MSTRRGGISAEPFGLNLSFSVGDVEDNVRRNRASFFQALGIPSDRIAIPRQVHSSVVQYVKDPGIYPDCDGLITDRPGVFLAVTVADCLPVLVLDTKQRVVAAIHAGWRGTAGMIAFKGVTRMVEEFHCSPGDLVAYIGPGAGSCCYNVGADVARLFAHEFSREEGGKIFIDLKAAITSQLLLCGIHRDSIETSTHCTIDTPTLLHSHRRDNKRSGRMMAVIGLKAV